MLVGGGPVGDHLPGPDRIRPPIPSFAGAGDRTDSVAGEPLECELERAG